MICLNVNDSWNASFIQKRYFLPFQNFVMSNEFLQNNVPRSTHAHETYDKTIDPNETNSSRPANYDTQLNETRLAVYTFLTTQVLFL